MIYKLGKTGISGCLSTFPQQGRVDDPIKTYMPQWIAIVVAFCE